MQTARCPSCGTKVELPEGQPLPRCKHCWSPLQAVVDPSSAQAATVSRGNGLDALFAAYSEQVGGPAPAGGSAQETCCPWCGAFSDPGLFCSDCGSPLLEVV